MSRFITATSSPGPGVAPAHAQRPNSHSAAAAQDNMAQDEPVQIALRPTSLGQEPLRDAHYIAEILAIPSKTVLQYARDGRLPCVRIGKHVRFRVSDVDAALTTAQQGDRRGRPPTR
jgi:excisionase family DNA binding protein